VNILAVLSPALATVILGGAAIYWPVPNRCAVRCETPATDAGILQSNPAPDRTAIQATDSSLAAIGRDQGQGLFEDYADTTKNLP
jgi:hypothetical protein